MRSRVHILLFLAVVVIGVGLAIQSTPAHAARLYSLTPSPEPPTATPIPTAVPPTAVPPTPTETPIPPPPTAFPPTATTAPPATEAPTAVPPATAIPPTSAPPATEIPTSGPPATAIPTSGPPVTEVPTSGPPATALPPTSGPTAAPPVTTGTADIVVTKQVDRAVVRVGDPLRYTIVVENIGNMLATDVQVVDTIPAWLKLIDYRVSQGTVALASGTVVAQIGDLAPGARATLTIDTVVVAVGGTLANTAKGTTTTPGENPANNTSTVVVEPGGQPAAPSATPRPQPAGLALNAPPPEANSSLPHTAIGDALPLPLILGLIGVVAGVVVVMIRATWPRQTEEEA